MAEIEIIDREGVRLVKITLQNETVRAESGAMYYMRGDIQMESAGTGGLGGFLKSAVTGENIFRPTYKGTGELYLEPSFGGFHILELQGEEWIMDAGGYFASEETVEITAKRNKLISGLFGGEGLFQTVARGRGKLVLSTPGPIREIHLQNNRLVVDGKYAVARKGNLDYRVEKAARTFMGSMLSGEGFVNVYEGTGTVLIARTAYGRAFMKGKISDIISSKVAAAQRESSSSSSDS
ncbi:MULTISPECIES: TIGR00266 family protein [Planktothricoides]|uniref:TIGR00266 family protein n=1 Tax=Planktothricoides raciborskii FACHB-1370 TaxID=2949576 RepID=A0ABR8EJQ5_9CYAN|nr:MULTISPECIES: TIGR00266 family protein [Planktothricoides]MBD2546075.1 TIGR00266 family protein [Planktothricoides raciborskii FACHB-1370]MBD2584333.1 TIGR00266 family protein [Planktothricoides raciborskii FACHB-1261]